MNKLVINTANEDLIIALLLGGNIFSICEKNAKKHNEILIPLVDRILDENRLKIEDINELGVVIGPGSFTGIRVGIATIKAFRDSLNINAKGINNLDYLYVLANKQFGAEIVAIYGSHDSYFVARKVLGKIYKYERNLTLNELKTIAGNNKIGMFKADENLNCCVVKQDAKILLELQTNSVDETLIPVYYQLSQAENEKLKRGEIKVLEATKNDLKTISKLESENISSNPISFDILNNSIKDKNHKIYIVKFNEEIVGFILLEKTDEINIESVVVDKNYRNLGLATQLINRAKTYAKRLKIKNISLEVSTNNINAFLLYEKFGFKLRRERKKYYSDGSDCLEMSINV